VCLVRFEGVVVVGLCSSNPFLLLGSFVLGLAGLVYLASGVAPIGPLQGAPFRERAIVGGGLLGTAAVLLLLSPECYGLFSDAATSVSNAPGP
jgi:hypothetical protein